MRIIKYTDLQEAPWKNGGGITREIATAQSGSALVWRISMADVGVDGPFSIYEGLQRILTVIEGKGMELISSKQTLQANFAMPVRFDGAEKITSKLLDGPLRDLNLIYDPTRCEGNVIVIKAGAITVHGAKSEVHAIHCIQGNVKIGETDRLSCGDTALIELEDVKVITQIDSVALLIRLVLLT